MQKGLSDAKRPIDPYKSIAQFVLWCRAEEILPNEVIVNIVKRVETFKDESGCNWTRGSRNWIQWTDRKIILYGKCDQCSMPVEVGTWCRIRQKIAFGPCDYCKSLLK